MGMIDQLIRFCCLEPWNRSILGCKMLKACSMVVWAPVAVAETSFSHGCFTAWSEQIDQCLVRNSGGHSAPRRLIQPQTSWKPANSSTFESPGKRICILFILEKQMTQVETSNSSIQGLKCLNMTREENLYPPHPRETDDSSRNLKFFNSRFEMFEYD